MKRRRIQMRKLLAAVVAGLFALSTVTVFAASHAGAKMDDKDKEKKTDTKPADSKPADSKPDEKKPEPKK
jgi:Spy/CpxP family protein refolding chaperone